MKKIIIDTDPGCDDMLAILLMCGAPDIDVLFLTTVAGNVPLQKTTNNARYVLDLANRYDTPVHSGAEKPLRRQLETATVHGESGLGGVSVDKNTKMDGLAVEKILEAVSENPNEVTLLILGPQTNIAAAIERDSQTMKRVKELVIMGGAFDVPGNHRGAEFNMGVDPEAAAIVANFPVRKSYVPLDICNRIQVPLSEFKRLQDKDIREAVVAALTPYIHNIQLNELPTSGALMYDVLAAYYLMSPEGFSIETRHMRVDEATGQTVDDTKGISVNVVTQVQQRTFMDDFVKTISRGVGV